MFIRQRGFYQQEAEDPTDGKSAGKTEPDPKDVEIEALRASAKAAETAAEAAKAAFEQYKTEQAREKMTEQQKLVADKDAADKRAEAAEKKALKAEKAAEKSLFGAKLLGQGLKSEVFVDTVLGLRKEGESAEALATRLKAQEEFSGLFGSRIAPPKAPALPGGKGRVDADAEVDDDEDDAAFKGAFPKDEAARKAAKAHLAKVRDGDNKKKGSR